MKKVFVSFVLSLISLSGGATSLMKNRDCLDCFNFVAPKVNGSLLSSPATGLLIYNTSSQKFEGLSSGTGWHTLTKMAESVATVNPSDTFPSVGDVILCNATSAMSLTLFSAAAVPGREYTLKKTDSSLNQVTISAYGTETIDGAASIYLSTKGEVVKLFSDGTSWHVFERDIPGEWTSYTPTAGSPWSISSVNCKYRRDQHDLLVRCLFTAASSTTEARISLPTGIPAPAISSITRVGTWMGASGTPYTNWVLLEPSVTYLTFGKSGSAGFTKQSGTAVANPIPPFGTTGTVTFWDVRIPIIGW